MRVWRTKYGPVEYRATVGGKKVAYTTLRSSYMHEADSIIGFQMLNDPDYVKSPQTFQSAVQHINYTFNWFYADSTHTAYYNSGDNPVRATGVDAEFPVVGAGGVRVEGLEPGDQHRRLHPGLRAPQLDRPGLLHLLEQQAGHGLHDGVLGRRVRAPRQPAGRPGEEAGRGGRGDPGRRW